MFGHRRSMRRSAEVTLVAFLLSMLALTPLALRAHPVLSSPNFHSDFCTATPPSGPAQALPAERDPDSNASAQCDHCAGC
ncbi:MAG: hypothetical protein ABWY07_10630, partial [Burkholderiales bacterium]